MRIPELTRGLRHVGEASRDGELAEGEGGCPNGDGPCRRLHPETALRTSAHPDEQAAIDAALLSVDGARPGVLSDDVDAVLGGVSLILDEHAVARLHSDARDVAARQAVQGQLTAARGGNGCLTSQASSDDEAIERSQSQILSRNFRGRGGSWCEVRLLIEFHLFLICKGLHQLAAADAQVAEIDSRLFDTEVERQVPRIDRFEQLAVGAVEHVLGIGRELRSGAAGLRPPSGRRRDRVRRCWRQDGALQHFVDQIDVRKRDVGVVAGKLDLAEIGAALWVEQDVARGIVEEVEDVDKIGGRAGD